MTLNGHLDAINVVVHGGADSTGVTLMRKESRVAVLAAYAKVFEQPVANGAAGGRLDDRRVGAAQESLCENQLEVAVRVLRDSARLRLRLREPRIHVVLGTMVSPGMIFGSPSVLPVFNHKLVEQLPFLRFRGIRCSTRQAMLYHL